MRGGKKDYQRVIAPDPKYGSVSLAKFINHIMMGGKKTTAQTIVYDAFDKIAEAKKDPMKTFEEALKTVQPQVEVRSRRVGGANYQVPMPVSASRQNALTFRWIVEAARNKKGSAMADRLATVLLDSAQGVGDAIKKRDDVHRMAEANKAFAHFARFAK
ncbi:MAG: 30S ribosomal protein S7 [Candidatus Magasanikbacteria bacterium RIFOXYD2_FULL_39_9]|uniref:Small ribosomal subunit protein uS7 n=1 Tax=Candidatus Magasanikbacteria bacterium RIFOXYD1_FULL_40_23 TaxID=1798705 RepID=A0A1F6P925_9BACT|nr:MAG: 30S ribosomal protein S7 [Candidatus Magasanikbacteria bacterium RIFOXYD2_FULL_39_9]OGH92685.1 MAG: 30S ribosomal protein S7 [Candidatus Magasanikbacteria bacterium RIFOXYD1_FULL_40_23]